MLLKQCRKPSHLVAWFSQAIYEIYGDLTWGMVDGIVLATSYGIYCNNNDTIFSDDLQ